MIKPSPGPHPARLSIPLGVLVRDYLALARTSREAKRILAERKVLVDKRVRRDPKFPVGLMDVVDVPELGKSFRVLINRQGRLVLHEVSSQESSFKLCRVKRKSVVKGGKVQLALHDGRTLLGEFMDFRALDVVKLSLPDQGVMEKLPLQPDYLALIVGGKNVGRIGRIVELKEVGGGKPDLVVLQTLEGEQFQTPANLAFTVGREEPMISLPRD